MENFESDLSLVCLYHPKVFTDIHNTSLFECGHLLTGIINFSLLVPRQYRRYLAKFYAYPNRDPTAKLRAPWATSLRCHGALGVTTATLRRVSCDATCFRGDLIALVLSMFKTWRWPRQPWRPHCDLQCCHGTLWDLTTTQRRSSRFYRSQRGRRPVWLGLLLVIQFFSQNHGKYATVQRNLRNNAYRFHQKNILWSKLCIPLAFNPSSLSQIKTHKLWMFAMLWDMLRQ